ncbi:hypothetical protein [Lentibacillus saliphilus]|uniref:hypothetical protein n=1 Tax=Lentibacillus saliphilus TaxID=2737028 RepID=UPI001FE9B682|nr:hypothetical protein [Lentibacillus saliphilus]
MNGQYYNKRRQPNQAPQKPNKGNEKKQNPLSNYTMQDLFKGKHLDLVAAALLLSGKLEVDAVQLFRNSPIVSVTLIGKYLTNGNEKADKLADFLEENGDMTIDDVFEAFQKKMDKG